MGENAIDKLKSGEKLYQKRARKAFPILVRQAIAQQPIFYSDLAQELNMPNPRNLNYVVGCIGEAMEELSIEWKIDIPQINFLVVNKQSFLPGNGIGIFLHDTEDYSKLSKSQKRKIVDKKSMAIYLFSRWIDVLDYFELENEPTFDYSHLSSIATGRAHGAGESAFHKSFKEFISRNPKILGLPKKVGIGDIEVKFPSEDIVDVLFKNGHEWVVAEVKSRISDKADIYRGLHQCVKYEAIVKAYQKEKGLRPNCRVILVVEDNFPEDLNRLKNILGITVIEHVSLAGNK